MYKFDALKIKDECVEWIRDFFEKNGKGCNAVIGILMPYGDQADIDCSYKLCEHLGIKHFVVNVKDSIDSLKKAIPEEITLSSQSHINLPPRIRMSTLYAVSQSMNGRVVNTCNLSEDWVGYSTRYGDAAGDFSPLSFLTVTEVKEIGRLLGLPIDLVEKTPIDGLCGKTDEENLGFTYEELDIYIREGKIEDLELKAKIDLMHERNLFKLQFMPCFKPEI